MTTVILETSLCARLAARTTAWIGEDVCSTVRVAVDRQSPKASETPCLRTQQVSTIKLRSISAVAWSQGLWALGAASDQRSAACSSGLPGQVPFLDRAASS